MNKWILLFLGLVTHCRVSYGGEPIKPTFKAIGFMVHFSSRYRGVCQGVLVSKMVVLTSATCVINHEILEDDHRPVTVVVGTNYRHPRRGIRVQVTKIIRSVYSTDLPQRAYEIQTSVVLMLLKRKIQNLLAEVPLNTVVLDIKADTKLTLQEECLTFGWHFFYKDSPIYSRGTKFLLQRNIRAQFVTVVKTYYACEGLAVKFQFAISNWGYKGFLNMDKESMICTKDTNREAQPCHGMYGAPLICRNKLVGMLMANEAQWVNCTGFSNMWHSVSSDFQKEFFECTKGLFEDNSDEVNWNKVMDSLNMELKTKDMYGPEEFSKLDAELSSSLEDN